MALPPPWASEESPRRVGAEESSGGCGALRCLLRNAAPMLMLPPSTTQALTPALTLTRTRTRPNAIAKHNYNFGSIGSVEQTPDDSKVT